MTSELCAAFHLPVPQFPHVYKGTVEKRKADLHQGGLGCVFSCMTRDCFEGESGSGSGPREAEPVACAKGRGGLVLPPFWAETRAGCFLMLSSPPYSYMPLRELLGSMSSCSEEFTPHLSSKQKTFFFFFFGRDCSNVPSGHRLPRQCLLPVPLRTSGWLSLQPPTL